MTGDPHIRFYAGMVTPEGHALGTLCVIDREPRALSADQQRALRTLAAQVMQQFESRRYVVDLRAARDEAQAARRTSERGF